MDQKLYFYLKCTGDVHFIRIPFIIPFHLLLFAHSPRSKEMHNFLLLHPYFLVCNTKIMQNLFTALPVDIIALC